MENVWCTTCEVHRAEPDMPPHAFEFPKDSLDAFYAGYAWGQRSMAAGAGTARPGIVSPGDVWGFHAVAVCDACGRKTWDVTNIGRGCGSLHLGRTKCPGLLIETVDRGRRS
jgi:hypothetical protein